MEKKRLYKTRTHEQFFGLLSGGDGEILRCRLDSSGYGVAYTGNDGGGLLTFSNYKALGDISDRAVKVMTDCFTDVARDLERPVLLFRLISRELSPDKRFYLVRLSVYFGEQGRLI